MDAPLRGRWKDQLRMGQNNPPVKNSQKPGGTCPAACPLPTASVPKMQQTDLADAEVQRSALLAVLCPPFYLVTLRLRILFNESSFRPQLLLGHRILLLREAGCEAAQEGEAVVPGQELGAEHGFQTRGVRWSLN